VRGESGCHALAYEEALRWLGTSQNGLSQRETERRLREVGLNQLVEKPRPGLAARFIAQLSDLMTLVLLAATIVSGLMGVYKDEPTPLQQRFHELSRYLVSACIAVCACVAALGLSRGEPFYTMFLAGVSLAVAAIPEGLPAIVTIVLALGVQRIAKVNALVRRLPA